MSAVVWAVLVLALVSVGLIACGVAVALDVRDAVKEMEGGTMYKHSEVLRKLQQLEGAR
jgi:1,4-dihydroxy-2-naphthoate octaprenyltransferase